MIGAELGLAALEGFLEERQGQIELPGGLVAERQVVHAVKRAWVIGPALGLRELEGFLEKRQGQIELAGGQVTGRQVAHAVSVSG